MLSGKKLLQWQFQSLLGSYKCTSEEQSEAAQHNIPLLTRSLVISIVSQS